jgi:hypothetical protein
VTLRVPAANNRPMSIRRLLPFRIAVALACCAAFANTTAQTRSPAPDLEKDPEFQSLIEKTNLYVRALNSVSSALRSYDRYASWVDVKKGPTGKERYITYGLYEINKSSVNDVRTAAQKGPAMKPPLPELDATITRMSEAFTALEPLVKKAHDYYDQEDWKDDNAIGGQELHAQMMPLFQRTFEAERELRRGLDEIKRDLDKRQLAEIEKTEGRKYHWHLRSYLVAAKELINLLPENPEAPLINAAAYKERYSAVEETYNAFQTFGAENPDELKKVVLGGMIESSVKDFYTASKFLRRTLEAPKMDRSEYYERVGELARKYNELINRTNSIR